jgi:hypothetical protein
MYRSWSYILMVVATLVGLVALLWPSPQVFHVAEDAPPAQVRPAAPPRAEAPPAKAPKGGAKAAGPKAPEPPPVAKKVPPQNTTAKRLAPTAPGGMQPNLFGKPGPEGAKPGAPPPKPSGAAKPSAGPRPPGTPPRPTTGAARPAASTGN